MLSFLCIFHEHLENLFQISMQSKLCASCNIILVATIGYKYKVDETVYEIWRYRNIYWLYMIAIVLADYCKLRQSRAILVGWYRS